jgi:hypothetical protein
VCLTGQLRSFPAALVQWRAGPLFGFLRSLGEIDWFVVSSRSVSFRDAENQRLLRSLHPVATHAVEAVAFESSGGNWSVRETADRRVRINVASRDWLRASVRDAPDPHARSHLLQLWQLRKCAELITQHERVRGVRYDALVRMRPDLVASWVSYAARDDIWTAVPRDTPDERRRLDCLGVRAPVGRAEARQCTAALEALARRRCAECASAVSGYARVGAAWLLQHNDWFVAGSRDAVLRGPSADSTETPLACTDAPHFFIPHLFFTGPFGTLDRALRAHGAQRAALARRLAGGGAGALTPDGIIKASAGCMADDG